MKYNAKYDRWVSKEGLVYRYDKKNDKLVLASMTYNNSGYLVHSKKKDRKTIIILVHRLVWETFKCEIPQGYEIDHINAIRDDNRLENLRCVTRSDNMLNPITRKRLSKALKGRECPLKGKPRSDFGKKFKEHFGITDNDNHILYDRELHWYRKHNKVCRWEVEDKCKS